MAVLPSADSATETPCLLRPDVAAAGVDPRRPGVLVVVRSSHDGGAAVGGQRHGNALSALSNRRSADKLAALLVPTIVAAGVDPRRPGKPIVDYPAHNSGFSVRRQRDGPTLLSRSDCSSAYQF